LTLTMFSGLLLWAAVTDFRRYLIPNQVSLGALALYPAYVLSAPEPIQWMWALVLALIFFAVGFVMYLMKTMRAGDAKVLPVVVLWAGHKGIALLLLTLLGSAVLLAGFIGLRMALSQMRASDAATEAGGATIAVSTLARLGRLLSELRHVPFLKIQI